MLNDVEAMLKRAIKERGCVAARFRAKLPNGSVYFATYFDDKFTEKEVVWNSELSVWSELPASPGTQRYVVDMVTEVEDGLPVHPSGHLAIEYFNAS